MGSLRCNTIHLTEERPMPCWLLPFLHHPVQPLVFVAPMQEWTFGA